MLEPGRGLRSKSPELVRQELWGLLLAHYAIRSLMTEAANSAGIDPDRLSFIRSINVVRRQVTDQAAFPPGRLADRNGHDHRRDPPTGRIRAAASEPTPASSRKSDASSPGSNWVRRAERIILSLKSGTR